jgi:hypothetical protein
MCPGLFRPLRRGERKKGKLDITYDYGDEQWQFWGPEPLGADDMRLLQGILSLTGPYGVRLTPAPKSEKGKELREKLEPEYEAVNKDASVVETSFYRLLKVCGWSGDDTRKRRQVLKSLKRMSAVTVFLEVPSTRELNSMHLLGFYFNEKKEKLAIALNWRLAAVVFGWEVPFALISLVEVRQFKSDSARVLHQWLSAYVSPGSSKKVRLDNLIPHVWPDDCDFSSSTLRMRRKTIRECLAEIAKLPAWSIQVDKCGVVHMERSRELPRMLEEESKENVAIQGKKLSEIFEGSFGKPYWLDSYLEKYLDKFWKKRLKY